VRLAFFPVGYQLVENQRVYIASARPKYHQDDHLELVQTHNVVGQGHPALDDKFAQQRGKDLCTLKKGNEPSLSNDNLAASSVE